MSVVAAHTLAAHSIGRASAAANIVDSGGAGFAGITRVERRHTACLVKLVRKQLEKPERADSRERSVATGVFSPSSQGLTTYCVKTYPSAAAREGSVRAQSIPFAPLLSTYPSPPQAKQVQGRRPSKEFFQ